MAKSRSKRPALLLTRRQLLAAGITCIAPANLRIPAVADDNSAAMCPEKYTLDYPVAERFCPPVREYFAQMNQSQQRVGGKIVLNKPNGGYGLPTVLKSPDGRNLVHLGADVAWYRVGERVHAVADGVVRLSVGPQERIQAEKSKDESAGKRRNEKATAKPKSTADRKHVLEWGNLVVIEHRLPDGSFVTTLYGHLANRRLVEIGDIIKAGQPIGEVGKNSKQINGGYQPHLHFGVRQGRRAERNTIVTKLSHAGNIEPIRCVEPTETEIEITLPQWAALRSKVVVKIDGIDFPITRREGRHFASSGMLWLAPFPEFHLVGYSPTTVGWFDPTQFLRSQRADTKPPPFLKK